VATATLQQLLRAPFERPAPVQRGSLLRQCLLSSKEPACMGQASAEPWLCERGQRFTAAATLRQGRPQRGWGFAKQSGRPVPAGSGPLPWSYWCMTHMHGCQMPELHAAPLTHTSLQSRRDHDTMHAKGLRPRSRGQRRAACSHQAAQWLSPRRGHMHLCL